ncbi:hypothetical protein P4204_00005, partial [Pseudomonas aeruginosa]|nr:hypothetical protein [Pseudomonas aeruginosa]
MATGQELDLALRIRADGNQGAQDLDNISSQVEQIGTSGHRHQQSAAKWIGEVADQQAARLKRHGGSRLQQQAAFDALGQRSTSQHLSRAPQLP